MSKRPRVPGPIVRTQNLGNTSERTEPGVTPWTTVDVNDGSWTKYDPNNGIVSVATSTGGMRIVWDSAESAHRFTNSTFQAGRWHKKLKHPDGHDLTWSEFFNVEILTQLQSMNANTPDDDKSGISFGIAGVDITNSTTNEWIGAAHYFIGSGDERLKTFCGGSDGWSSNASNETVGAFVRIAPPIDDDDGGDVNPRTLRVSATCLDSNRDVVASDGIVAASNRTHEWTATDNVYLFLSPNWSTTNTGVDDADSTWKIWYRVTVARDGLNPTYVPGGGDSV